MSDEEFDLQGTTLDRISEIVEELADDQRFVSEIIGASGANFGPDESAIVKKLIRRVSQEVLDLA